MEASKDHHLIFDFDLYLVVQQFVNISSFLYGLRSLLGLHVHHKETLNYWYTHSFVVMTVLPSSSK